MVKRPLQRDGLPGSVIAVAAPGRVIMSGFLGEFLDTT
jgi:hypothetical protein